MAGTAATAAAAAGDVTERGPYMTPNRALMLERRLSEMEGRFNEQVAQLNRELAEVRASQVDLVRGLVQSLIDGLRSQVGKAPAPVGTTELRRREGS